jgi:hypothetical protein
MGKLEKIVAELEALPEDVRADILEVVEGLIAERAGAGSVLTDAQVEEVRRRLADPDDTVIPDDEMERLWNELTR